MEKSVGQTQIYGTLCLGMIDCNNVWRCTQMGDVFMLWKVSFLMMFVRRGQRGSGGFRTMLARNGMTTLSMPNFPQ